MINTQTQKALDQFGAMVIQKARERLKAGGSNASGDLSASLRFESKVTPNAIQFDFYAEDYWKFVDKGVKGKASSVKAPNSPYRFGSGTGKKGGLTAGIDKWVIRKGLTNVRGADGRFIPRKQMVRMIARSVYMKGIRTTEFFSKPFEEQFKLLQDVVGEKYGNDLEEFLKKNL